MTDQRQAVLAPELRDELRNLHNTLLNDGRLLSRQQLASCYARFRDEFGPEVLRAVDGAQLLAKMHNRGRDSLMYWLEFKDDEELPAVFGSIAGGNALKFGIYQSRTTGAWMTGPPQRQQELSLEEAIDFARRQRDQLLAGVAALEQLPESGSEDDYAKLQRTMEEQAPDVSDGAWGHKYFHMVFPSKLDDYHTEHYQRFHLIKMLQSPPGQPGRYACAGRYVAIANELGIPLNHLTSTLNERNGRPHKYWRIATTPGGTSYWAEMRDGGFVAVGWPRLGDLSDISYDQASKVAVKEKMARQYAGPPQTTGRAAQQVFSFCTAMADGDIVVAAEGATVLGTGRVTGDYRYDGSAGYAHQRPVEWLCLNEWRLPTPEGLRTTVSQLYKHPANLVAIEERVLGRAPIPVPVDPQRPRTALPPLQSVVARIQQVLERKGQVILYGPPGTGKTYWAEKAALELAARRAFEQAYEHLSEQDRKEITGQDPGDEGLVRMCCFHPAYGCEDFLAGYRPETVNGRLSFVIRDGIFKKLCADAERTPDRNFYLIVDEINRGDIPRIFGELITVLEKSKRGKPIILPLTGASFSVPANVFIIGTMNTADRSIALLDTALRRRFGFIELMPAPEVLGDTVVNGIPLGPWLTSLNRRLCEHIGRDARNLQVGHSYLMHDQRPITSFRQLRRALREDLLPLLQEYCYDDYGTLEAILGRGLVDVAGGRYRDELFEPDRDADLVHALLLPDPDISASPEALTAEEPADDDDMVEEAAGGEDSSEEGTE